MSNKIIGFTTGVFDMFHIGHLNILKRSKKHCDYLIVGISTDDLVYEYKKKKPIIDFSSRSEIVNSIKYVDKVVSLSHRDKIKTYHEIKYDIVFVGDDWKGSSIFNRLENELNKYDAKVHYFEYTDNISSTKYSEILENIYNNEVH
jgi:glycerol-3-phosphate cytidylyltransferase